MLPSVPPYARRRFLGCFIHPTVVQQHALDRLTVLFPLEAGVQFIEEWTGSQRLHRDARVGASSSDKLIRCGLYTWYVSLYSAGLSNSVTMPRSPD